jgi:DNA-binding transcriptional LysR family regulator
LNTKQLHYFIVTAEKKSIAGAAKALDIAAPAISHQLGSLEHELKATLFIRDYKGVSLTPSGHRFFAHAQQLMQKIEFAKRDLLDYSDTLNGVISIGMNEGIGNVLSMPLIDAISQALPGITLDLRTAPTYRLNKWLHKGKIDIALTYKQLDINRDVNVETLMKESLFLVMSKENASTIQTDLLNRKSIEFWRLVNYDLITLNSRDSSFELLNEVASKAGISLNFSLPYSGQLATNMRYVAQGRGLIVLPSSAFYHLEQRGIVHSLEITEPDIKRDVLAMSASSSSKKSHIEKVITLIKTQVGEAHSNGMWRGTLPS